jgi:hypothetical protein
MMLTILLPVAEVKNKYRTSIAPYDFMLWRVAKCTTTLLCMSAMILHEGIFISHLFICDSFTDDSSALHQYSSTWGT